MRSRMRSRMTRWSCAGVVVAMSLSMATPASAQLGRLRKIAGDAVKDVAKEAAGGKKPETPTPPGSKEPRVDYAITEARLTTILGVLQPYLASARLEMEERASEKTAVVAAEAVSARRKAVNDCLEKATKGGDVMPDLLWSQTPKGTAFSKRLTSVSQRMGAAQAAGKFREFVYLSDTSVVMQTQYMEFMFPNTASCGATPYTPAAVLNKRATDFERTAKMAASGANSGLQASNIRGDDAFDIPADKRGGMTAGQFGRIREAIAIWQLQQTGDLPPAAYKFTDAEVAALSAKAAELKAFGPVWKTNTLQWASWNDIKSW